MAVDGPLRAILVAAVLLSAGTAALAWAAAAGAVSMNPAVAYWVGRWPVLLGAAILTIAVATAFSLLRRAHKRRTKSSKSPTLRTFETLAAVVLVLFVSVALLQDFGTALVSLGLVGVGLTLALQRPILSMAGWAAIRFGRLFREGDRIEVEGIVGDVLEVSLLKTRLWEIGSEHSPLPWGGAVSPLRQTGRIVSISNATFLEKPVANATSDFDFVFDEFVITTPYESDWKAAESLLEDVAARVIDPTVHARAAAQYERLTRDVQVIGSFPAKPVVIMSLKDSWIEFRLRYLVEVRQRSAVRTQLARAWQEATADMADRLPQVYPRIQSMPIGADGRATARVHAPSRDG